jgi:two-component system sensor histidine kinase RegB
MQATSAQTLAPANLGGSAAASEGAARGGAHVPVDERGRIHLSWLVQLHWWAILGQAVVIVASNAITGPPASGSPTRPSPR